MRLELTLADTDAPVSVVVVDASAGADDRVLVAPNGSTISVRRGGHIGAGEVDLPDAIPSLTVTTSDDGDFGLGRAGMEYRDLLPDRWGGRFIASHITIRDGGDVADWVHFHRIRFQMIYVAAGWVDVVYEDQGAPFRMNAGDCVLQPPEIRHRVLRSSPGLEVIEIGCPAEHDTIADHELTLPNPGAHPDRDFVGQRFVRHVESSAATSPWVVDGLRARDTGIGAATNRLAGAVVVSPDGDATHSGDVRHDDEFVICVGLRGAATVEVVDGQSVSLTPRSSVALPPGSTWRWEAMTADSETLVVSLGADAIRPA